MRNVLVFFTILFLGLDRAMAMEASEQSSPPPDTRDSSSSGSETSSPTSSGSEAGSETSSNTTNEDAKMEKLLGAFGEKIVQLIKESAGTFNGVPDSLGKPIEPSSRTHAQPHKAPIQFFTHVGFKTKKMEKWRFEK